MSVKNIIQSLKFAPVIGMLLLQFACGGGGGGSSTSKENSNVPTGHALGGALSGLLTGNGLALAVSSQEGGTVNQTLSLTQNGDYQFSGRLPYGEAYYVSIETPAAGHTCAVSNPSGRVTTTDINNIGVACTPNTYSIGGTVTGLTGTLKLQNNGGEEITVSATGANTVFTFPTSLTYQDSYMVTVSAQPVGQLCGITHASASVPANNVTSVAVECAMPVVTLDYDIKQVKFSWAAVPGASYYQLLEDPDGLSGYTPVDVSSDANITSSAITATNYDHEISLPHRVNARYIVQACDVTNRCVDSAQVNLIEHLVPAIGYFKASNTGTSDIFGTSIALSADGHTLAVGAPSENSAATGINGDQADNSEERPGAVYVFSRTGTTWTQEAYVKASNTGSVDNFGISIALSADGDILAVGADWEASAATGINGDEIDNYATAAGAVYVFSRTGATWAQQAYVKASNTDEFDFFGSSVALSADGSTLAVGALLEDSAASGINGNQADNSAYSSGAVYIFSRTGATWAQQAYVKASNTDENDQFGFSVALSSDGSTLAVGAYAESSAASGINGNQADNSAYLAGAVYVFSRADATWAQQAYVKASNTDIYELFGSSIALSAEGGTLAVGAPYEESAATGIDGDQADNFAPESGAVYLY